MIPPPTHASTGKVVAAVAVPQAEPTTPAVKQTAVPGIPPDVFRAVTSTPAVPVTAVVALPAPTATNRPAPAATTEAHLNDVLADVERTILAIKQKSATTNAAGTKKP